MIHRRLNTVTGRRRHSASMGGGERGERDLTLRSVERLAQMLEADALESLQ